MSERCETCKRILTDGSVSDGNPSLYSVGDFVKLSQRIVKQKREHLLCYLLDTRLRLISKEIISIGTLTASLAHPREIFHPAVKKSAASIVLVHNHPSGDPSPSDEDNRLTARLKQCAHIMGIELLDHIIVAQNGCYSYKSAGVL